MVSHIKAPEARVGSGACASAFGRSLRSKGPEREKCFRLPLALVCQHPEVAQPSTINCCCDQPTDKIGSVS